MKTQRFAVGTNFIRKHGKRQDIATVVDYLVTSNLAGEIVKTCYVAEIDFLGQKLVINDVCDTMIARNII